MNYAWKTFSVPLIVGDEAAKAIMREAERKRQRDLDDIKAMIAATREYIGK